MEKRVLTGSFIEPPSEVVNGKGMRPSRHGVKERGQKVKKERSCSILRPEQVTLTLVFLKKTKESVYHRTEGKLAPNEVGDTNFDLVTRVGWSDRFLASPEEGHGGDTF